MRGIPMRNDAIAYNEKYWNNHADLWFGTTALPQYGVKFPTEDELKLFGNVTGKKMLEICCGSGHSLKYHAERKAGELWGIDISQNQLDNAQKYLDECGYAANLICSSMEEMNLPQCYFDYVYSIYGIGWTTDLQGTFNKIASCLKKMGYLFLAGITRYIIALPFVERMERICWMMAKWYLNQVTLMNLIIKCLCMIVKLFCVIV